jgi:hypothetical protein
MAKKGTTTARRGGGTGGTRRAGKTVRRGKKGSTPAAARRAKAKIKAKAKVKAKPKGRAASATRSRSGTRAAATKVGSSSRKAGQFAGRNDFGVPARRATPSGRAPDSAFGLPRNENGRSGEAGDRTHGVGSAPSNTGSGSGGDVDTDYIGVGVGPVSQAPPSGDTSGPDAATGNSGDFASAPDRSARGRDQLGSGAPPKGELKATHIESDESDFGGPLRIQADKIPGPRRND